MEKIRVTISDIEYLLIPVSTVDYAVTIGQCNISTLRSYIDINDARQWITEDDVLSTELTFQLAESIEKHY